MRIPFGRRLGAIIVLLAGLASPGVGLLSCKKAGVSPGALSPALAPGQSNGDRLLATVLLPSLERTFATAEALKEKGALGFGAEELRAMLKARLRLPQEVLDLVDASRPVAFALVARPDDPQNDRPYLAGSLELGADANLVEAARVVGELAGRQKDAHEIRTADGGSLWVVTQGKQMSFAATVEDLGEAGAHALSARTRVSNAHLFVRSFPRAFARDGADNQGDWRQQMKERLLAGYEESYRQQGRTPPRSERASVSVAADHLLEPAADTQEANLEVTATVAQGLALSLTAVPFAGSDFEKRLASPQPFPDRPVALAGAGTALVMAVGPSPKLLDFYGDTLEAQAEAEVPGAAEIAPLLRRLLAQLDGSAAGRLRTDTNPATADWAFGLRSGARSEEVLASLEAFAAHPALPTLLGAVYGFDAAGLEAARQGEGLRLGLNVSGTSRPGTPAAVLRALFGGERIGLFASVKGNHLLFATEPGAEGRLAAAAAVAAGPSQSAALAEALAETQGRAAMSFFDAWRLARPLLSAFLPPAQAQLASGLLMLPGLNNMALPIWMHLGGGETFTAELRVPIGTMTNVQTLFSMLGKSPLSSQP